MMIDRSKSPDLSTFVDLKFDYPTYVTLNNGIKVYIVNSGDAGKFTITDKETGEPIIDEETGKEKTKGIWKRYTVFSREDIIRKDNGEALPSKFQFEHFSHEDTTERMREGLDRFNKLFNYYCQKHGIPRGNILPAAHIEFVIGVLLVKQERKLKNILASVI